MNRFVSVALAGAIAVSAMAVTAGSASAGGWKPGWHPPYGGGPRYYHAPQAYNPGPAIVAGTVLGLTLGALATQPYYDPYYPPAPPPPPVAYYPSYGDGDPHFNWCAATYGNYNSATDTWTDYRGIVRRCVDPY